MTLLYNTHLSMRFSFRFLILIFLVAAGGMALAVGRASWEQVGAPLLMLLLAGGASRAFLRLDSGAEERPFVMRLFLVALLVHGLAAFVYNVILHGPLLGDAGSYDLLGSVISGNWSRGLPVESGLGSLRWILKDPFPWMVSGLYWVLGRSPNSAIVLNIVLGALSVYCLYRITAMVLGPVTARFAGWLAVLYSGFWIYSLMLLKDAASNLLLLLFFYALYRLGGALFSAERPAARAAVGIAALALMAGSLYGIILFREYIGEVLIPAAGVMIPVWIWKYRSRTLALGVCVAALAAIILVWPEIARRALPEIRMTSESAASFGVVIPPTVDIGTFLVYASANPVEFGRFFLFAAGTSAIAPFAWILPGLAPDAEPFSAYTVAFPGMWIWYLCLPFAVLGLFSAVKRSKGDALPLVLFGIGMFMVFSILIPREIRHRDVVMPIALMLAAEGLVFCRSRWTLGLLFWIPLVLAIGWDRNVFPYAVILLVLAAAAAGWILLRRRRTISERQPA